MNKLKAFWASLPHPVQAIILAFATAAAEAFLHAFEESFCVSLVCLKHYAATSVSAGLIAARAFYMLPNKQTPPSLPPDVPKAA